ncbi:ATPase [Aerophototrophica crusticola]|uniref:ATPase n=1 Tax=Aerophototrophica crusticola TaxID=1709002 RepID=A0A858R6Z6_9PROT|nr:ATPase [Rhodospirillaceae bacterium B3]
MKRFYKQATAAGTAGPDGWTVLLDGKPLRTPAKLPLAVPTRALAEAIAAEWQGQGEEVVPRTMPLTQLSSTAIDGVRARPAEVADAAAAYAGTDLLCYRADHPQELAERQAKAWQPLLDWAALRYDALLRPTTGIRHVAQDESALKALRAALEGMDEWRLTALQNAVGICGSLVIALALLEGKLDARGAFDVSQLDESFQIEQWGEDAEAAARRKSLLDDLVVTERFLTLLAG